MAKKINIDKTLSCVVDCEWEEPITITKKLEHEYDYDYETEKESWNKIIKYVLTGDQLPEYGVTFNEEDVDKLIETLKALKKEALE